MADVDWPSNLCVIERRGYRRRGGDNTRRTAFQDGYIEQKTLSRHPLKRRTVEIIVPDQHVDAFEAWRDQHAAGLFNFPIGQNDDGTVLTAEFRVPGGDIQLNYADGERITLPDLDLVMVKFWRARVELEGY